MPIDPSIIFRMEHARPAEYAMQGRTDRARLADYTSQAQARDFELGQRREEAGRAQSLRDLMGQYGQGGISRDDMVGQAYGIDPETARQFETHYAQLDEASRKRVRDMNDRAAALIATVSDQPSYEAALRQYAAEGGDVSEFPARYDPNHVDGLRRQVIGAKALMDQASKDRDYGLKSAEFSYRQQNDAANRGVRMRGQDITMRGQDMKARGGAAARSLPAGVVKMQNDELNTIGTAAGVQASVRALAQQLESGDLTLGPARNAQNQLRNFAGVSTPESRNYATLKANVKQLVNDILLLNKGVQTEGDAQRAIDALLANLNDTEATKRRLLEIGKINDRAIGQRKAQIDQMRADYGISPLDYTRFEKQPATIIPEKSSANAAPRKGETVDGYRYVGGDPSQPGSWRKVK